MTTRSQSGSATLAVLEDLAGQAEQLGRSSLALIRFDLESERDRLRRGLYRTLLLALAGMVALQLLITLIIAMTWNGAWRVPALAALTITAVLAVMAVSIVFRPKPEAIVPDASRSTEPRVGGAR